MKQTRLQLEGMHCASCVSRIERALEAAEGVREADVSLATQQATVEHEGPPRPLIEAVERAGYRATEIRGADPPDISHHGQPLQRYWRSRVIAATVLTVPLLVLAMTWRGETSAWIQAALATPVQLVLGWPFYVNAYRALARRRSDMDTLVAMATSVAYGFSLIALSLHALSETRPADASPPHVYFETAAVILLFVAVGRMLEARAKLSAADALFRLLSLQPRRATRVEQRGDQTVDVTQLRPGDRIRVKPGERVPVDGRVVEGVSVIDESLVSGEPTPVEVEPGAWVVGGTVNQHGSFVMQADRSSGEGMLSQILSMVRRAQSSKARVQRVADRVAEVFVPFVIGLSLAALSGWTLLGRFSDGIEAMVAVLIVACPCALGLAAPMAVMVGSGLGARFGVLFKEASAVERAGRLTHMLLDKTGTLTAGKISVATAAGLGDWDRTQVLRWAAAVERWSEHPLAQAVVAAAESQGLELPSSEDFEAEAGAGVRGVIDGRTVRVGRLGALREEASGGVKEAVELRETLLDGHRTTVAVSVDGQIVGLIAFTDELKPEAAEAVAALKALGLKVAMVSGDHESTAREIARRVGIDEVHARVLPSEKQQIVETVRQAGRRRVVAMVGDGVNDAPALSAADVGVAVGGGTEIAASAGDVVLVSGSLDNLPRMVRLSRATLRRIHLGLGWAFGYNVLLLPVAAFGLMHPMFAAAAMSLSSVSVVLNALHLRWRWRG